MKATASASIPNIQRLVGDIYGDYATPEYVLSFMQIAQNMLFNEMLQMPVIGRSVAVVIIPSIGVGAQSLSQFFNPGGSLELLADIVSLKERQITSNSDADWSRMTVTLDMPGFTQGSYNHVYQYTGDDIKLPGADQDLQLRVFGEFTPAALVSADSPLVPGTAVVLEFRAAELILDPRNPRLAEKRKEQADNQQFSLFNRIVQDIQETPIRQRSFSGRSRMSDGF